LEVADMDDKGKVRPIDRSEQAFEFLYPH